MSNKKSTHFWMYADEKLSVNHSECPMGSSLAQELASMKRCIQDWEEDGGDGQNEVVIYEIREVKRFKISVETKVTLEEVK
jgi:hypothetical protein